MVLFGYIKAGKNYEANHRYNKSEIYSTIKISFSRYFEIVTNLVNNVTNFNK